MLYTRVCALFGVDHPVVLGGMSTATSPALVAAVSAAGGLGIQGCTGRPPDEVARLAVTIRSLTHRPFGLNLLLFLSDDAAIAGTLAARPAVFSTAWARADQDLRAIFARAHDAGAKVVHMVSTVDDARRAASAGADTVVAQGTEGGGHVGVIGTMVLVPRVARAVAPLPVLAAGGVADGAGLAAALMLGAEGVLLGTRFLTTPEAPVPSVYKRAIVESDGHNTLVTEIPDVASGTVWPGAYVRVVRNRVLERWLGREGELRYGRDEVSRGLAAARQSEDGEEIFLAFGATAGLIDSIEPAGDLVRRISAQAEAIIRDRAGALDQ